MLAAQHGSLSDQLDRAADPNAPIRPLVKPPALRPRLPATGRSPYLEFFNGLGGFGAGGKEYVTVLGPGQSTPAPWINVIANANVRLSDGDRGRRLHLVGQ